LQPVFTSRDFAYFAEDILQFADRRISEPQQIEVLRRAVWFVAPNRKKHRSLEHESIAMLRQAQAVQQSLECVPHQKVLELFIPSLGQAEQSFVYRVGDVLDWSLHCSASR
jgi:hypothetical protein